MQISYYKRAKDQLDYELKEIDLSVKDANERFLKSTACLQACLSGFRERLLENPFVNVWQEIYFFKKIKPMVVCELMFQVAVNDYRNGPCVESLRVRNLRNHLRSTRDFLSGNEFFPTYIASKRTYLDKLFFVRGEKNWSRINVPSLAELPPIFKYCDPLFSTSGDFLLTLLFYGEKFESFAQRELEELRPKLLN